MVRCSTLKEAELIPDSAVPYTLPESRWKFIKSSNVKRVGKGWGECSHTPYDMCEATGSQKKKKNGQRKVAVLERANRSWLVRERSWQPTCWCVCLSASECVCGECHRFRLRGGRGGKRASAGECSERSQRIGWSTVTEQSHRMAESVRSHTHTHTHTQVWHAVRKQSIVQFACLCLSVYIQVCVHLWTRCGPFFPVFTSKLKLKCVRVGLCFGRIRYSEGWWDK